jgi:hypothetical protein
MVVVITGTNILSDIMMLLEELEKLFRDIEAKIWIQKLWKTN